MPRVPQATDHLAVPLAVVIVRNSNPRLRRLRRYDIHPGERDSLVPKLELARKFELAVLVYPSAKDHRIDNRQLHAFRNSESILD